MTTVQTKQLRAATWLPKHQFHDSHVALVDHLENDKYYLPVLKSRDNTFIVLCGLELLLAKRAMKQQDINVSVLHEKTDSLLATTIHLAKQRYGNISPIELAQTYQQFHMTLNVPIAQIAKQLQTSRPKISNYIRMLKLDDFVKNLVHKQLISPGHAIHLCSAPIEQQRSLAQQVLNTSMSSTQLFNLIHKKTNTDQNQNAKKTKSPLMEQLEEQLSEAIANPLTIDSVDERGNAGTISIQCHSIQQLDGVIQNLKRSLSNPTIKNSLSLTFSDSGTFDTIINDLLTNDY